MNFINKENMQDTYDEQHTKYSQIVLKFKCITETYELSCYFMQKPKKYSN